MNTPTHKQEQIQKAFRKYLATRRAYERGQATIQQLAHTLAVYDVVLALTSLSK